MKKHLPAPFLTLLALFFGLNTLHAQPAIHNFMSYNVHRCVGTDNRTDFDRVARVINSQSFDAVAIQEVDSMTQRSNEKYELGELSLRTNMHATYAPAISFDGGKYGIGILSRQKPISVKRIALPGAEEKRALLIAEFTDYYFACTHLSLTETSRQASLAIIQAEAEHADKPFIIAGDFNDTPDSPFMKEFQRSFTLLNNPKVHTVPVDAPKETIDYITLYNKTGACYEKRRCNVAVDATASDHLPVAASMQFALSPEKTWRTAPYLQNPSNNGITVMWQTTVPANTWVEYGTDTLQLKRARTLIDGQADAGTTFHRIRIDSLRPGTTYYYRAVTQEMLTYQAYYKKFGSESRTPFHSFRLPSPKEESFTAVVFNDLHQNVKTFRALCSHIENVPYDFTIFLGDCVDDPVSADQVTPVIDALCRGVHADSRPAYFMRGNHEIRNAYSVGLRRHFDYPNGRTYGAFSWGDTRLVMLDCGEDKPDSHPVYYGLNDFTALRQAQTDFMKQEFRSKAFKRADKRILLHHIPLFGNDWPNLCDSLWRPILEKARFDVSLNAHTHKHAYHPAGSTLGNPFPVIIGGGPSQKSATVMVIEKRRKQLRIKVIDTEGKVLLNEIY